VDSEARVRPDHPLQVIKRISDTVLEALTRGFFQMHSGMGRPSIAPEMPL
jgi:hypothetical protein